MPSIYFEPRVFTIWPALSYFLHTTTPPWLSLQSFPRLQPCIFSVIFKQHTFFRQIPVAFVVLEKRMSITEVIHTLYQEKSFHKPNLSHDGAKKALEGTAWADVSSPEWLG